MNVNKYMYEVRTLRNKILKKLVDEFSEVNIKNFLTGNPTSSHKMPKEEVKQQQIDIDSKGLFLLPLYKENQRQLNWAFSWISLNLFVNIDFETEPFVVPTLPDREDENAKQITLISVMIEFMKYVNKHKQNMVPKKSSYTKVFYDMNYSR